MRIALVFGVTALLTVAAYSNPQEDIKPQLDQAYQEYNSGNFGKSADILTEVSDKVRALKAQRLSKFIPAAPEGWLVVEESDDAFGTSMMGAGSMVSRKYTNGTDTIELSFATDNKLMGVATQLLELSKSMGAPADDKSKKYKEYTYMYETANPDEYRRVNDLNLIISEKLSISVEGKALTEEQAIKFIDKIDLEGLKQEAAR